MGWLSWLHWSTISWLVHLLSFTASSFTIAAEGEIILKPQPFPIQRPPFQARLLLPEDSHILATFIDLGQFGCALSSQQPYPRKSHLPYHPGPHAPVSQSSQDHTVPYRELPSSACYPVTIQGWSSSSGLEASCLSSSFAQFQCCFWHFRGPTWVPRLPQSLGQVSALSLTLWRCYKELNGPEDRPWGSTWMISWLQP